MDRVVAEAAEDDVVVAAGRPEERVGSFGSTLNGVRLTDLLSTPATLIVSFWTWPGV